MPNGQKTPSADKGPRSWYYAKAPEKPGEAETTEAFRTAVEKTLGKGGPRSFYYSSEQKPKDKPRSFWYKGDDKHPRGWYYEKKEKK